jgi:hypothetical protein
MHSIQRGPHSLAYAFESPGGLDGGEHMGGVCALLAPGLEESSLLALGEQLLEEQTLGHAFPF